MIPEGEEDDGEMRLEVLGADANTYIRKLQPDGLPEMGDGTKMESPPIVPPPMTPDSKKAFESLQSVYLLQQQLL